MFPYNFKVWGYEPSELGTQWMGERVATVDLPRILRNLVFRKDDLSWGPNSTFPIPYAGGNRRDLCVLCSHLPEEKVHLGIKLTELNTSRRTLTFANGQVVKYDWCL